MPKKPIDLAPLLEPKPEQPTFPMTNVQVTAEGMVIQTYLTANDLIVKIISAQTVEKIIAEYKRQKQEAANMMQTIASVQRTRND